MGVFEKFNIRKRETFHPDREKIGAEFVISQLDEIDIQTFIDKFSTEVSQGKKRRVNRESRKPFRRPLQPRRLRTKLGGNQYRLNPNL
jgi:hypothetical protein